MVHPARIGLGWGSKIVKVEIEEKLTTYSAMQSHAGAVDDAGPGGDGRGADPANPQSWNRYAYVMNNPLNATDPFGLQSASENDQCSPNSGQPIGDGNQRQPGKECGTNAIDGSDPHDPKTPDSPIVVPGQTITVTPSDEPSATEVLEYDANLPNRIQQANQNHAFGPKALTVSALPPQPKAPTDAQIRCNNLLLVKATGKGVVEGAAGGSDEIKQAVTYVANNRAAIGGAIGTGVGSYYALSPTVTAGVSAFVSEVIIPTVVAGYVIHRIYEGGQAAEQYMEQNESQCK